MKYFISKINDVKFNLLSVTFENGSRLFKTAISSKNFYFYPPSPIHASLVEKIYVCLTTVKLLQTRSTFASGS